ncbi:MAG TPA: Asp-tRNA(Asn)/Glu-tRNA(Gln) amidotransferase subunit GatC [Acidobacteriota bacterium]|nr:Asp-tRNA(Asn)/Glu-tRNA(Gln) amidotransferase subunit GatC [Acidobacteriota bacterium]
MKISRDEVEKIAALAHLEYSPEQMEEFVPRFREILDHIARLEELDTQGIEPMYHGLPGEELSEDLREDETRPVLTREEALENAPEEVDGQFRVPRVIES